MLNSKSGFEIVNLQPNPVTNSAILNISVANKQLLRVYITDSKGSRVMEKNIDAETGSNQNEFNLSHLPGGTYMVTVISDQNERKTIAFVKQ